MIDTLLGILPTTRLQTCCKIILSFNVVVKRIKDPRRTPSNDTLD